MNSDVKNFIDCLKDARSLLVQYPKVKLLSSDIELKFTQSERFNLERVDQWSEIFEQELDEKPKIRILQHMACTGGTLISKCLAAMPNVVMLSEVNPLSELHIGSHPKYAPTDLTYLAIHGRFPLMEELREKIFKADIEVINKHVLQLGKALVIREHSHSDYLVGESANECSTSRKLLKDDYTILSALTVRHPIDSYLSVVNNGWVHFSPPSFDEYCRRYLAFILHNHNLPMYKYEDFVVNPAKEIKALCKTLELRFNEDFRDIFDLNVMSGDSGRSSNVINKRKRREYDEGFLNELNESSNYVELCVQLQYETSITTLTGAECK